MKNSRYIFGYLFVRFSKLLALLTVVATLISTTYLLFEYRANSSRLSYHQSSKLEIQFRQIEASLAYAQKEVSKISSVGDLPPLKLPSAPKRSEEFDKTFESLQAADYRKTVLQERLTSSFAERAETLKSKIKEYIKGIEKSRGITNLPSASPPNNNPSSQPSANAQQTKIYDNLKDNITGMQNTLDRSNAFLIQLAGAAEKDESKRDIQKAKEALKELDVWLSQKTENTPETSNEVTPTTPPIQQREPLTKARDTYELLEEMINQVQARMWSDWHVYNLLRETTETTDKEAQLCRDIESQLSQTRLSYFWKTGACIAEGLIIAFLVLVFADFLQSFFDTASNSASIYKLASSAKSMGETET